MFYNFLLPFQASLSMRILKRRTGQIAYNLITASLLSLPY
ncbi:Uncharacterised protein [Vibrio cholerae]|nr:Uncharacterised protein [Vibrio cholerae]CSC91066.1 Uncharacterised protein [Vibrio cholerae]